MSVKHPIISIIVPIYNAEKYLRRCIDSVITQTYQDWELLLIDDGSPDNSGVICEEYARTDSRIQVYHKKNGGVSSARNLGIEKVNGDWIAFVDPDDYVSDNWLSEVDNTIANSDADMIVFGNTKEDINGNLLSTFVPEKFYENGGWVVLMQSYKQSMWNYLYKKSLIIKYRCLCPVGIRLSEDHAFILQYLSHNPSIAVLKTPLYHYIVNPKSLINSQLNFDVITDNLRVAIYMIEYIQEYIDISTNMKNRIIENCVKEFFTFVITIGAVGHAEVQKNYRSFFKAIVKRYPQITTTIYFDIAFISIKMAFLYKRILRQLHVA